MPRRSKIPCLFPGCPRLIEPGTGGYCDDHKKPEQDHRKSAAARGYGARWRRIRAMFLARHPICSDRYGVHSREGRVEPATDVHHKKAKRNGGRDSFDNLEAMCHSCHSRVTREGE